MTTTRSAPHLATVALLVGLAACGGSSDSAPDETAPSPVRATTTTVDPTEPTTTTPDTTTTTITSTTSTTSTVVDDSAPTTEPTVTTPAPGDGFLPEGLGRRLDSASGIDTQGEIVELLDGVIVFIPSEPDPDDANVIPPLPEDREILIAYAEATAAVYEQVVQVPVAIEPSERMQSSYLDEGELYRPIFEQLNSDGQHLDFQFGSDVSRPVVIADPRSDTEAFVFDCSLVASVYVTADGALVEGETPEIVRQPLITKVVKQDDGSWIVAEVQEDDRACA